MNNKNLKDVRIKNKITGEIVTANISDWKKCLNLIKYYADAQGIKIMVKASTVANNLRNGYEDEQIIVDTYICVA